MAGVLDLQVNGAEKLAKLGKALRETGDVELKREMTRGLRQAALPLVRDAKAAAARDLPHRGGLAARVARSRFSVQARTGGRRVGVRIVANGPKNAGSGRLSIRALNRGEFSHPVYARGASREQWTWVQQRVKPGWFDNTLESNSIRVRGQMIKAIDETIRKVQA